MSRCRNIKPGLWLNEELADISITARYLFPALWCHADKEGRLEYRPKKLKAEIFPYDNINIQSLIVELHGKKFIEIYEHEGQLFINIPNFKKHQNPHPKEKASELPAPINICIYDRNLKQFIYMESNLIIPFPSDVLIPIPSSTDDKSSSSSSDDVFSQFWKIYPRKEGKGDAEKAWKKIKKPSETFFAIESALSWQVPSEQWTKDNGKFIPHPASYLNKRRWEDEPLNQKTDAQAFCEAFPELVGVR